MKRSQPQLFSASLTDTISASENHPTRGKKDDRHLARALIAGKAEVRRRGGSAELRSLGPKADSGADLRVLPATDISVP